MQQARGEAKRKRGEQLARRARTTNFFSLLAVLFMLLGSIASLLGTFNDEPSHFLYALDLMAAAITCAILSHHK